MKVRCVYNTGKALKGYKNKPLSTSNSTVYGGVEIGNDYLVMGIVISNGCISYIVDDGDMVFNYPYQLFEIIDNKHYVGWYSRIYDKNDDCYPEKELVIGYYELCFYEEHINQLMEIDSKALNIYFTRKKGLTNI